MPDLAEPPPLAPRPNQATAEGRELGRHARFCDAALAGQPDGRSGTCALRHGDHLANGSPETLRSALKCALERTPFWCHEHDQPCAGWLAIRAPADELRDAPWDHPAGADRD